MKTPPLRFAIATALAALLPSLASAQAFTLAIDATAKTFSLSGSSSGTLYDHGFESTYRGIVIWSVGSGFVSNEQIFEHDNPATTTGERTNLIIYSGGSVQLSFGFETEFGAHTITGSETPISYASLGSSFQSAFESKIGQSMTLVAGGTDFGDIALVAAIPEPAHASLLFGLGALSLMTLKRRRS